MSNRLAFAHSRPMEAQTTAGLLLSLAAALPAPAGALGRRARHLAHRLADHTSSRADRDRAADLLATLLTAADPGLCVETEGLLDEDFDA